MTWPDLTLKSIPLVFVDGLIAIDEKEASYKKNILNSTRVQKTIPIWDQTGQDRYPQPISNQNCSKTIPFDATYSPYKEVSPSRV